MGDFTLLLAGDAQGRDGYAEELKKAIAAAGLEARVKLTGHCSDMAAAYALSDCVLSPSIEPEPFGRTAVEAQAASRPVIVSDAGGQQETVIEGKTGFRIPPGDTAALAGAMASVMAMGGAARAQMGAAGHDNAATHYSVGAMCGATLSIYARLIAQKRAARERDRHRDLARCGRNRPCEGGAGGHPGGASRQPPHPADDARRPPGSGRNGRYMLGGCSGAGRFGIPRAGAAPLLGLALPYPRSRRKPDDALFASVCVAAATMALKRARQRGSQRTARPFLTCGEPPSNL
jgi:hypothetical protein